MSFEVSFRKLSPNIGTGDLQTLSDIARITFSNTFVHYDEADLNDYLESSLSPEKLRNEIEDPKNHFYFVLENQEITGYLKWICPSTQYLDEFDLSFKRAVLLQRFYFLPEHCGTGLAPIALEFVTSYARHRAKADLLYLSVWEKNYRAQSFYQRNGFRTLGSFDYPVGRVIDVEFLYTKRLS